MRFGGLSEATPESTQSLALPALRLRDTHKMPSALAWSFRYKAHWAIILQLRPRCLDFLSHPLNSLWAGAGALQSIVSQPSGRRDESQRGDGTTGRGGTSERPREEKEVRGDRVPGTGRCLYVNTSRRLRDVMISTVGGRVGI